MVMVACIPFYRKIQSTGDPSSLLPSVGKLQPLMNSTKEGKGGRGEEREEECIAHVNCRGRAGKEGRRSRKNPSSLL